MNYLSLCTINVNSLLRANSKKQTEAPYLSFMRKTQDILLMADTRISPQKFEFLSDKLSLSNQINVKKRDFFPHSLRAPKQVDVVFTSHNHMTMF